MKKRPQTLYAILTGDTRYEEEAMTTKTKMFRIDRIVAEARARETAEIRKAEVKTTKTVGGVLFCYNRQARGSAARALRAAGVKAEYLSSASLTCPQDRSPTPRYQFNGVTLHQMDTILASLETDGKATEIYYEPESN